MRAAEAPQFWRCSVQPGGGDTALCIFAAARSATGSNGSKAGSSERCVTQISKRCKAFPDRVRRFAYPR